MRRASLYLLALAVAFLIGFVPMWLQARMQLSETRALQAQLNVMRLESTLAAAALLARRGEYDPARDAMTRFYSDLRVQIDHPNSVFGPERKEGLREALSGRDEVITLLARSDPASAERLAALYMTQRPLLQAPGGPPY
jgi:hypothetical protein